jgi:hypothetical protein
VQIVTGIGNDPLTMQPLVRARVWCKFHGARFQSIAEYRERLSAERVKEALLERDTRPVAYVDADPAAFKLGLLRPIRKARPR